MGELDLKIEKKKVLTKIDYPDSYCIQKLNRHFKCQLKGPWSTLKSGGFLQEGEELNSPSIKEEGNNEGVNLDMAMQINELSN